MVGWEFHHCSKTKQNSFILPFCALWTALKTAPVFQPWRRPKRYKYQVNNSDNIVY